MGHWFCFLHLTAIFDALPMPQVQQAPWHQAQPVAFGHSVPDQASGHQGQPMPSGQVPAQASGHQGQPLGQARVPPLELIRVPGQASGPLSPVSTSGWSMVSGHPTVPHSPMPTRAVPTGMPMDVDAGQAPGHGTGRSSTDTGPTAAPMPSKLSMPMPGSGKAVDQWWAGKMAASAEGMAKGPHWPGFATQDKGTGGTSLGLAHWGEAQPQAEALHRALAQAQQHFEAVVTGMKVAVQHKHSQSVLCVWLVVLKH